MLTHLPRAFLELERSVKEDMIKRLIFRRRRFIRMQCLLAEEFSGEEKNRKEKFGEFFQRNAERLEITAPKILLIGDRPGPGRPDTPGYVHCPFYSVSNSSLWLNAGLARQEIPEQALFWVNSHDEHDTPTPATILQLPWDSIICLGRVAEKWVLKNDSEAKYTHVLHPQAAKRFHSGEPYELLYILKKLV